MLAQPATSTRRHGWAFLLPLLAVSWGASVDDAATGGRLLAVAAICVVAGAAWQLLHRRDVVDRLTHFAAGFAVVMIVPMLMWNAEITSSIGLGFGLGGALTGCVFAEQWLRRSDRRRTSPAPPESAVEVPDQGWVRK